MLWLIIIILVYFLFAVSTLGDEYLLNGPPNPKNYSFYVGILGIFVLLLIPFVGFSTPDLLQIILSLLAGSLLIIANFCYYTALEHFEVSKVAPAIGGFLPLFTFGIVYFAFGGKESLTLLQILAFISLILGSIFITLNKRKSISLKSLKITSLAAFLFAITFILTKYVYTNQSFWGGFIWMRIGGILASLFFLFSKEVRSDVFRRKPALQKKTGIVFLGNQIVGSSAFLLQNWAIALVPFSFLPFINALEGIKYVFLLILAVLISKKFPQILKEEVSKEVIFQKIIAILFIGTGLVILALF